MKKKYRAIQAAIGCVAMGTAVNALAQASSQVQLYGLLGLYAGSSKRSGGPLAVKQLGPGGLTTSYWGVRGIEDLGSGYRTIFVLESFFQPDTGLTGRNANDPFFSRNSYVGFEGGFGKLTAGRQTNPTYVNMGTLSPFGISVVFSPLVLQSFVANYNGALIGDTVWNNAIQYTTPRVAGLTGTAVYALGEVIGSSGIANLGLHANYVNGPFSAAFSSQRVRTAAISPMTQQNGYLLGATYDFQILKLYGAVETSRSTGVTNRTHTYDLGLKVPVAKSGAILAEWAQTKRTRDIVPENTRNTASLGYDYFLSTRTDVYAVYSYDKQTSFSSAGTYAVAIRHTF